MADARDLDHADLIERVDALLAPYDAPEPGAVETVPQRLERINLTIDQMPQIYRWLVQLWSWTAHWTDAYNTMWGTKNSDYQRMRQRRDLLEKAASAAKLRYEAASRLVTLMESFDPTGMPRSRRGQGA